MFRSNRKFKRAVAALVFFVSFGAFAQTTLPTIEVTATAPAQDGGIIKCTGGPCTGALNQQVLQSFLQWQRMYDSIPPDDLAISRDQFCRKLEAAQPPGCSLSSPPSVPGFDPNWMGNGCGSGSLGSAFANAVIESAASLNGYEGNLDYPLPGIGFFPACQGHDRCYGSGEVKGTCDFAFENSLEGICATSNQTYRSTCDTLTSLYTTAVEDFGSNPYNAAQADLTCASWAHDMKENGCDE